MGTKTVVGLVILFAALIVGYSSVYTVHETEQALVLRFGEPRAVIREPGIQFKVPFVDQTIILDNRIIALDMPEQEVIAEDQKRLVVDAFARYKITEPLLFFQTVTTINAANSRLLTLTNSSVRRVLGENSLLQIVRDERAGLMNQIRNQVNEEARDFGITVVDVRIRRADLPEANSLAIFRRMETEAQQEAAEIRAQGNELAQQIRARADRESTIIVAEAESESQQIRGQGDAERNNIFAASFNQDPEFFNFYRSMQAYERGLGQNDTRLLLSPDSEFFRFFNNPTPGISENVLGRGSIVPELDNDNITNATEGAESSVQE